MELWSTNKQNIVPINEVFTTHRYGGDWRTTSENATGHLCQLGWASSPISSLSLAIPSLHA